MAINHRDEYFESVSLTACLRMGFLNDFYIIKVTHGTMPIMDRVIGVEQIKNGCQGALSVSFVCVLTVAARHKHEVGDFVLNLLQGLRWDQQHVFRNIL